MKIRIRHLPDGAWLAGVDGWIDFAVLVAEESGSTHEGVAHCPPGLVASGSTPWEASTVVCEAIGEDVAVEWETLPWTAQREAHGITSGVCELLGVSTGAQRAIARSKWGDRGRSLACAWCTAPAPWNAEDIGWRWVKLVLFLTWHNNGWACPGCAPWAEPTDPGAKVVNRNPFREP